MGGRCPGLNASVNNRVGDLPSRVGEGGNRFVFPGILLSNANHVLNKLDELHCIVDMHNTDVVCITESWMDSETPSTLCNIGDFNLYRRDRSVGQGGGVLCFVRSRIQSHQLVPVLNQPYDNDFEIMWVLLRPNLLPRPLSCLIIGVAYVPPWYNAEKLRLLKAYFL